MSKVALSNLGSEFNLLDAETQEMFEDLLDVGEGGGGGQGDGEESVLVLTEVIVATGAVIRKVGATLGTSYMTKDTLVLSRCKVLS